MAGVSRDERAGAGPDCPGRNPDRGGRPVTGPARTAAAALGAAGPRLQDVSWDGSGLTFGAARAADGPAAALGDRPGYFVDGLPVEIHCHGMEGVDFSDFDLLDLAKLNLTAAREGVLCVPTLYLRRERLDDFTAFMRRFGEARRSGELPFVPGVALEGPLLASHGGTPAATVWPPTRHEWEAIARCGEHGLRYVVVSPDAFTPASGLRDRSTVDHPDLAWIVTLLVESGVQPALGHYTKDDPAGSARLTEELVEIAWRADTDRTGPRVITDHLFNDMPLKIRHAFRTRRARAARDALLASYDLPSWNLADLDEQVGEVPAAIMRLCRAGRVAACINFDGEHVDTAVAARAAEIMGWRNVMLMTDRCDSARLGGQPLHQGDEGSLWYQEGGVVAAGSQPIDRQIGNALSAGLPPEGVWNLVSFTAYRALGLDRDPWAAPDRAGCFVAASDAVPDAVPGTPRRWERTAVLSGSRTH